MRPYFDVFIMGKSGIHKILKKYKKGNLKIFKLISLFKNFLTYPIWYIKNTPLCKHNVIFVVTKQINISSNAKQNFTPDSEITLILFVITYINHVDIIYSKFK